MAKTLYSRFTIDEREILFKRLAEGKYQKDIAKELSRDPSTISREIQRSGMSRSSYRPSIAEEDVEIQKLKRRRKYKLVENRDLAGLVESKLKQKWSPEQISGRFKKDFPYSPYMHISHETIYRYIYSIEDKVHKMSLISNMRQSRRRRRPRKNGSKKRTNIKNIVSIHERPQEVEDREEPGHWEGDLVVGKDHRSAVATLVERTTRYTIIVTFNRFPNSIQVAKAFAAVFGMIPSHLRLSVTLDRGSEFAAYLKFTELTCVPVYFADPYCPYQRGTNENINGLIRQYCPKKTDFGDVDDRTMIDINDELNDRPRKTLEFFTPNEMYTWFSENPNKKVTDFFKIAYGVAI